MKAVLVLLLCFTIAFAAFRQDDEKAVNFIEELIRKHQPEGQIVYADAINPPALYKIKTALSKSILVGVTNETKQNSITLTRQEKKYLFDELETFLRPYWTENLFPNSKMIKIEEVLPYIRKSYEEYSENYNNPNNTESDKSSMVKNYQRPNVFEFSKPIYLRNKSCCLMFISSICGSPCGYDELCFYKMENNKWVKWIVVVANEY